MSNGYQGVTSKRDGSSRARSRGGSSDLDWERVGDVGEGPPDWNRPHPRDDGREITVPDKS